MKYGMSDVDNKRSLGTEESRIRWVDCAKGMCICFVILMHVAKPDVYSQICVPIFLCMFFFISGYLTPKHQNIKGSAIKMLKLFLLYGAVVLISIHVILNRPISLEPVIGMFWQVPTSSVYSDVLWFLPCIIVSKLVFGVLKKVAKKESCFCILALAATIVGACYIAFVRVCLPWHIQTALFMQGFMLLGFLFKKYEEYIKPYETLACSALGIIYFTLIFAFPMDADLHTLYFTSFSRYCVQAVVGTVFFALLMRKISQLGPVSVFCQIGRYSLFYYAFEEAARVLVGTYIMPHFQIGSLYAASIISVVFCVAFLTCILNIKNGMKNIFRG